MQYCNRDRLEHPSSLAEKEASQRRVHRTVVCAARGWYVVPKEFQWCTLHNLPAKRLYPRALRLQGTHRIISVLTQVISRTFWYEKIAMSQSGSAMTLSSSASQGIAPASGKTESAMPKKTTDQWSDGSSAGGSRGGAESFHEAITRFDEQSMGSGSMDDNCQALSAQFIRKRVDDEGGSVWASRSSYLSSLKDRHGG